MKPMQIVPDVYYVGVVDWTVRDFHGYKTERGATYNSYLIMDEKICLIDTAKKTFASELLHNISQVTDPSKIDYVIVNHVEPEHAGALPELLKVAPNAKFVITAQGKNEALRYCGHGYAFMVVKDGDILSIGKRELTFATMPMLHWPDNMATYSAYDEVLFSNDAFGQHYATSKRFDDEVVYSDLMYEAKKYFANILWLYAKQIDGAVKKVAPLKIKMIAPAHGVIWRSHIQDIVEAYVNWGKGIITNKVVIAYDTMWGSTEQMARAVMEGAIAGGSEVVFCRMNESKQSVWN